MSEKKKKNNNSYQKQRNLFMDTMIRMAGRSLEQALKDTFFRKRFLINQQYKYYVCMGDSPIAEFMIQKLDRERALIDMQEYQAMIAKTHEAVKQEAMKAAEEGVNEVLEELNKSIK